FGHDTGIRVVEFGRVPARRGRWLRQRAHRATQPCLVDRPRFGTGADGTRAQRQHFAHDAATLVFGHRPPVRDFLATAQATDAMAIGTEPAYAGARTRDASGPFLLAHCRSPTRDPPRAEAAARRSTRPARRPARDPP